MTTSAKFSRALLILCLALAAGLLLLSSGTASAAPPVAKDGKIYACYKAKGKAKGTIRLVRNGKVRCQRKWKKVSWHASGLTFGPGVPGPAGAPGPQGEKGESGAAGNLVVIGLEDKVSELLARVETLEGILEGVTNADLLNAISFGPVVGALCTQTEELNDLTGGLGTTLKSLNTLLNTLLLGFSPVSVPEALPEFNCPTL